MRRQHTYVVLILSLLAGPALSQERAHLGKEARAADMLALAKSHLEVIAERYGDTTAGRQAAAILKTLVVGAGFGEDEPLKRDEPLEPTPRYDREKEAKKHDAKAAEARRDYDRAASLDSHSPTWA